MSAPFTESGAAQRSFVIVAHRDPELGRRLRDGVENWGWSARLVATTSDLLAALAGAVEDSEPVAGILLEEEFASQAVRGALFDAVRCVEAPWKILPARSVDGRPRPSPAVAASA